MIPLNSNRDRLAANHHHNREEGSPVVIRKRGRRSVAVPVQADTFRPVSARAQAVVAYAGARPGELSLKVGARSIADRAGFSAQRPSRGQPQARLATQRDRVAIPGMLHPTAHPSIGRSVISPILLSGGSEL